MKTAKDLIEYDITVAAIEEMKQKYSGMKITDAISDKAVRAARTLVVSKRTAVEKRRVELNEAANEHRRKVNEKAKEITALLLPIEEPLQAECKRVDDEKAAIKAEKDRKERERIQNIQLQIGSIYDLGTVLNLTSSHIEERLIIVKAMKIPEDAYMEFRGQALHTQKDAIASLEKALAERLQFEKEEEARKAEAERLEAQRKEQEAAQAKIDEENRKIEEKKAKLEKEEWEKTEKARIAKEMEEEKTKAEHERLQREEAKAKEKVRQESLRPDKEKLIKFANELLNYSYPHVESKKAKEILSFASGRLDGIASDIKEQAKEL